MDKKKIKIELKEGRFFIPINMMVECARFSKDGKHVIVTLVEDTVHFDAIENARKMKEKYKSYDYKRFIYIHDYIKSNIIIQDRMSSFDGDEYVFLGAITISEQKIRPYARSNLKDMDIHDIIEVWNVEPELNGDIRVAFLPGNEDPNQDEIEFFLKNKKVLEEIIEHVFSLSAIEYPHDWFDEERANKIEEVFSKLSPEQYNIAKTLHGITDTNMNDLVFIHDKNKIDAYLQENEGLNVKYHRIFYTGDKGFCE